MFTLASSSFALMALLSMTQAAIIDNAAVASAISARAARFDGDYYVTNVKTGKTLSFVREDLTNLYSRDAKVPVTLETIKAGGFVGTAIAGLGKCASAQWGFQPGDAFNVGAVSYACQIGESDVKDPDSDLRLAKQNWLLIQVGTSSDSSDSSASAKNFQVLASSNKQQSDNQWSDDDSAPAKKWPDNTDVDKVESGDRRTWICKHDGPWLEKFHEYITIGGHIECEGRLKNYLASKANSRFAKRFVPCEHLQRRAQPIYAIIAVDHILDMTTRAIGSRPISTYGGYTSQELVEFDENDPSQQWYIKAA